MVQSIWTGRECRPGRSRSLGVALLAGVSAVALTVAAPISARPFWAAETMLLSDEALIMGGSGMPLPPQSWVDSVFDKFVAPNVVGDFTPQALFTPEGFYPLTGVMDLPFDTSVVRGVSILDDAIRDQLADGNNLVVFGYSQSAVISSLEMRQLAANPPALDLGQQLSFVLIGNPVNPNGGIFTRFAGLSMPSLGLTFGDATPPDTIFPTDIFTTEYDGWADFPRYPLNLLSVLNAFAGANPHFAYPDLSPEQLADAVLLPGSADLTGVGATNYWMIPTEHLPLLDPLRSIPVVGNPLASLLEPDLRVLVNLGYGSIENGWDPGPANVATGFGLFPTHLDPLDVLQALVAGTQQGVRDFMADLAVPSTSLLPWLSFPDVTNPMAAFSPAELPTLTDVVDALSRMAATAYGTLLPTADIINALVTSIPAYNADLFLDGIQELIAGDLMGLVRAFGDPIAADAALLTLLGTFQWSVLSGAVQSIGADLASLIPF